jgi:hypothetical protein
MKTILVSFSPRQPEVLGVTTVNDEVAEATKAQLLEAAGDDIEIFVHILGSDMPSDLLALVQDEAESNREDLEKYNTARGGAKGGA